MSLYLDGKVCSLLTIAEANNLNSECTIKTVSLKSITPYASDGNYIFEQDNLEDTTGNIYSYAIYSKYTYDCSSYYLLNNKYKYLTGTVAVWSADAGEAGGYIEVIGDGRSLYKKYSIKHNQLPFDISVDVSDVKVLIIKMGTSKREFTSVLLGNPQLTD